MGTDYDRLRAERDDLDFTIGGYAFRFNMVPARIVGIWVEREDPVDAKDINAFTQMLVDRVADAVDDGNGARERWLELCASERGPGYGELLEIGRKAWEVQSSLPTRLSGSSPPGPGETESSSKGA